MGADSDRPVAQSACPGAEQGHRRSQVLSPSSTIRDVPDSTHVLCGISEMSMTPSGAHSMHS